MWLAVLFIQITSVLNSDTLPAGKNPEIFTGGFLEVVQTGQMNASARLFRLFIGDPYKFRLPVSIYTGVTANNITQSKGVEDLVMNMINPASGIFNFCIEGNERLIGRKTSVTMIRIQYHTGFRLLAAYNRSAHRSESFFNGIGGLGLSFVTGAWENDKTDKLGIFWMNFRMIISHSPPHILRDYIDPIAAQNLIGYSTGIGIEINQSLNTKLHYFHFWNNREVHVFRQPFLQMTVNYSAK